MINDEKIKIKITERTVKRYKDLNYSCKIGDILEIKITDLYKNSHEKIKAICDICNKEYIISYYAYIKNHEKYNYYCCNNCKQKKIEKTNLERYGVNRPIQNKLIYSKLEETNLERYGFKSASKNNDIKKKIKETIKNNKINIVSYKKKRKNIKRKKYVIDSKYKSLNILSIDGDNCSFKCDKGHIYYISFTELHNRLKYNVEICTICNSNFTYSKSK